MTDKIRKDLKDVGFTEVSADVNLEYGGIFIRDKKDHFDIVKITDLSSACGADGQIMVEALTTSFDFLRKQLKYVLSYCDCGRALKRKDVSKANKRLLLAAAMAEYGLYDPVAGRHSPQTPFIAVLDRADHKGSHEKWKVNVRGWGQAAFRRAVHLAIDAL